MNKLLRALIAGYGAKKLGGGCLSTILIFLLIYWALGNCNSSNRTAPARPASLIQEQKIAVNYGSKTIQMYPGQMVHHSNPATAFAVINK